MHDENEGRPSTEHHATGVPDVAQEFCVQIDGTLGTCAAFLDAGASLAPAAGAIGMNLNQYGAACRCLLRLRENSGEPGMTDAAFIARFLPRYPQWRDRPGTTNLDMLVELARELRLATTIEVGRSYDRLLQEHRTGHGILVQTERVPVQVEPSPPVGSHMTLLVAMSEEEFSLWCPYPSGNSEILPVAKRAWWDRWSATGLVLEQSAALQGQGAGSPR